VVAIEDHVREAPADAELADRTDRDLVVVYEGETVSCEGAVGAVDAGAGTATLDLAASVGTRQVLSASAVIALEL
jgi:hypothetical protein